MITDWIDDELRSAGLNLTFSNTSPKSHSTTAATCRPSSASNKMRLELPLKAANKNKLMADRCPLLHPNRHCRGRQKQYWHNAGHTRILGQYMNRIDPTAHNHCHDCGHSPRDTNHLFICPSKPTTLTIESSWTVPTEAAKHLKLAIDKTS